MIKSYTDEEFNLAKSNVKFKLECESCHSVIEKEKRAIKYGISGYGGRQNDLCKDCFYKEKVIYLQASCGFCSEIFTYKKSSRKKSDIKLCSKKCKISYLYQCNIKSRTSINEKIKTFLKGRKLDKLSTNSKKCKECFVEFCNLSGVKSDCCDKFCTHNNFRKIMKSEEHRSKMSAKLKGKAGGPRDGGGYSKVFEYINIHGHKMKINRFEIELAKCLDVLKLNWKRNKKGFGYVDLNGNNRNYYPDFYVENFNFYVEFKGFVTDKMKHKMEDSVGRNKFKLLIVYSNDKRYRDLGLNLSQVQENSQILIENMK